MSRVHLQCCEAQPISAVSPKIYTIKLQCLHNTERPTKWSGHGKMIDPPWTTSTYKRPFTWEGNYLVGLSWKTFVYIRLWPLQKKFAQIMQIYWDLHAEITPFLGDLFGDFFSNLWLCRFTEICMQNPPWFGDFSQICHSADLLKSACRNPPMWKALWVIQP